MQGPSWVLITTYRVTLIILDDKINTLGGKITHPMERISDPFSSKNLEGTHTTKMVALDRFRREGLHA